MKRLEVQELTGHLQNILQQTKRLFNRGGSNKVWGAALKDFYVELKENGSAVIKIRNGVYLKVRTGRSYAFYVDLQMEDLDLEKSQAWRKKLADRYGKTIFFDTDDIGDGTVLAKNKPANDGSNELMDHYSEASSESLEMAGLNASSDDKNEKTILLIHECPLCLETICQCGNCLSLLEPEDVQHGDGQCPECGMEFKKQAE